MSMINMLISIQPVPEEVGVPLHGEYFCTKRTIATPNMYVADDATIIQLEITNGVCWLLMKLNDAAIKRIYDQSKHVYISVKLLNHDMSAPLCEPYGNTWIQKELETAEQTLDQFRSVLVARLFQILRLTPDRIKEMLEGGKVDELTQR